LTLTKFENGAAKNNIVVREHKSPTRSIASLVVEEMIDVSAISKGVTAATSTV